MHRREFLRGLGLLGCSAAAHPLMTTVTLAGSDGGKPLGEQRLVVMILRGAMDGLDVVQPLGAREFAQYRPTLFRQDAIALDGYFGLHPALQQMMPLWTAGDLGFVHATSTPYRDKRSHFVGQDMLEAGTGMDVPVAEVRDGWLNRLLQTRPGLSSETAYAIGIDAVPMLEGAAPVKEWAPETKLLLSPATRSLLERVYHDDLLFQTAAIEAMELAAVAELSMVPEGMASSAEASAAMAAAVGKVKLDDVGRLIDYAAGRLLADTRIAAFSLSGWDTHRGQKSTLPRSLMRLQEAVLRLKLQLGPAVWDKTTVLAMTEFGRTARENGTQGTDHGTAGLMVMAGGAVRGGKVWGKWPGLADNALYEGRDLMPTTDVRAWAAQVLQGLYGIDRATLEQVVFPGVEMSAVPNPLR